MSNEPVLFCMTCAGGRTTLFDDIEVALSGLRVVKLEYAGHGVRHREPLYDDFDALVGDMFSKVRDALDGHPYGLFGYSMGAVVALEVLRRIDAVHLPLPCHIFIAAHEPCTKKELQGFTRDEMDEWVKRRTISFGAIPDRLIDNRSFWRVYLPLYRTDYTLISQYRFEDVTFETDVPATVFYSETDTPFEEMRLWKRYFKRSCAFYCFKGEHFFIQEHYSEMAAIIAEEMGKNDDI